MTEELMTKSREELLKILISNIEHSKSDHDMFVTMGSLGIDPKYATMYSEAMAKIRKFT